MELQNKHKQSSVAKKSTSDSEIEELGIATEKKGKEMKTINYSRGCDVPDNMSFYSLSSDLGIEKGFELSDFNNTKDTSVSEINNEHSVTIDESLLKAPFVGVSLGMVRVALTFLLLLLTFCLSTPSVFINFLMATNLVTFLCQSGMLSPKGYQLVHN